MPLVVEILDHYVQGGGVATDGGLGIAAIEGGRVVVANGGGGVAYDTLESDDGEGIMDEEEDGKHDKVRGSEVEAQSGSGGVDYDWIYESLEGEDFGDDIFVNTTIIPPKLSQVMHPMQSHNQVMHPIQP